MCKGRPQGPLSVLQSALQKQKDFSKTLLD